MLLAGDIGGTKTVVALLEADTAQAGESVGALRTVRQEYYPSQKHASLESILADFLQGSPGSGPTIQAACFGVAGAIHQGTCKTTNLPWQMTESELAATLNCDPRRVKLLNDVEAAAYGMLFLKSEELLDLNPAWEDHGGGNIAVAAAGTGLGEAILHWDGEKHHPLASEGGHCSFAPQSELEVDLWRHLRAKFNGHVSYERILSGQGFFDLFDFLRQSNHYRGSQALTEGLAAANDTGERNGIITRMGLEQNDPLCLATLGTFLSIYGAEAGNLALKCMASGGVYLAGGIAPKMLAAFKLGTFLEGFMAKGRFSKMLRTARVRLALNQQTGLIGAGYYARNHLTV